MDILIKQNIEICKMMGIKVTFLDRMYYTWKLRHHADYELLIPVVDFIHKIGSTSENVNHSEYMVEISKQKCLIHNADNSVSICVNASPIKTAIFDCVAAFAELYNNNTIKH